MPIKKNEGYSCSIEREFRKFGNVCVECIQRIRLGWWAVGTFAREGVDERVAKHVVDEEVSVGDYILSGGELPALVLMETVSRFLPGFLGKEESLEEVNGSFPTYTRPEAFHPSMSSRRTPGSKVKTTGKKSWSVPSVLLSGDHKKIAEWRKKQGE